jgi:hypothetical protein
MLPESEFSGWLDLQDLELGITGLWFNQCIFVLHRTFCMLSEP